MRATVLALNVRASLESRLRHRAINPAGVKLFAVEAGPEDGPLVILLHGFPEFWYGWRHQMLPLADAGYRVLVPDQRGYHISDKPRKAREYTLPKLARDVVGLIDDADREQACIVGHDWGGAVAWAVAMLRPDRVSRVAILNAPHPAALRGALRRSAAQRRSSRYMLAFQLRGLAERRFARDGFAFLREALRKTSRPGTFTDQDVECYVEAWSAPGALTGMLNWYRAIPMNWRAQLGPRVEVPLLLIWGAQDRFLLRELVESSLAHCAQGRAEILEQASHWVQHEEPAWVNALLLEFLAGASAR